MKTAYTLFVMACASMAIAAEKDNMIPPASEILRLLPSTVEYKKICEHSRYSAMAPRVNSEVIIECAKKGEIIRPLHEKRNSEEKTDENWAYDFVTANVLYWWFNIRQQTPPVEQLEFIVKQGNGIKQAYTEVVGGVKVAQSRAILVAILRKYHLLLNECLPWFGDNPLEIYGEPAEFFKIEEIKSWHQDCIGYCIRLSEFSKNEKFKYEIARCFFEFPGVLGCMSKGTLPDLTAEDSREPDLKRLKALFDEYKSLPIPSDEEYFIGKAEGTTNAAFAAEIEAAVLRILNEGFRGRVKVWGLKNRGYCQWTNDEKNRHIYKYAEALKALMIACDEELGGSQDLDEIVKRHEDKIEAERAKSLKAFEKQLYKSLEYPGNDLRFP